MSFWDQLYLLIVVFGLIIGLITMAAVWFQIDNAIGPSMPDNTSQQLNSTFVKTAQTVDNLIPALYWIFGAIMIGATLYLAPNPILLVIWLIVNVLFIFIWDLLDGFLSAFQGTALGTTGAALFPVAISFFHNQIPVDIVLINFLIGVGLLAKGVMFK